MRDQQQNVYITAVLPAHDEHAYITSAIKSIRPYVNRIIVACDNCSDDTNQLARRAGADVVFNTIYNFHRKSGALNQALEHYVNWRMKNQYLLIMDADTEVVAPKIWFKKAKSLVYPNRSKVDPAFRKLSPLRKKEMRFVHPLKYHRYVDGKAYDCVGSIFQAPKLKKHNFIEEGQRLEWIGYRNKIERTRKVYVLTGTCSLISADMMHQVYLNYHKKQFYNNESITEDFRMTVDLKDCHARMISPSCCLCITATKPNARTLIAQRKRWDLGAIDVLCRHPLDEVMMPYLGQQLMLGVSVFSFFLSLIVSALAYFDGAITLRIFWVFVFCVFDLNQIINIWKYSNTFDKCYSASMIGWLVYSIVLDVAYLLAVEWGITGKKLYWNSRHRRS